MTTVLKGQPTELSITFLNSVSFATNPNWQLLDWNGELLQSGTTIDKGNNTYSAQFTVSKNMSIPNGAAELELEVFGTTTDGKPRSKSKVVGVVDMDVDWKSYGILFYPRSVGVPTTLKETALFPKKVHKLIAEVRDGYGAGAVVGMMTPQTDPTERSSSEIGYVYDINIPNLTLNAASGGWYPHQLYIHAEFEDGSEDELAKPIYLLSALALSHLTSVKRYLDKARLDEIDQNIGWVDEEILHYLLQGAMLINSINDVSYWTIDTMPSSLQSHLHKAAEWEGLNARYLAEGMIAFDFQGANSQLTVDRRDTIQTKMDEINGWLDKYLPNAKKAAISTFGPGTPPPGSIGGNRKIGALTISVGPTTNVAVHQRRWWNRRVM